MGTQYKICYIYNAQLFFEAGNLLRALIIDQLSMKLDEGSFHAGLAMDWKEAPLTYKDLEKIRPFQFFPHFVSIGPANTRYSHEILVGRIPSDSNQILRASFCGTVRYFNGDNDRIIKTSPPSIKWALLKSADKSFA